MTEAVEGGNVGFVGVFFVIVYSSPFLSEGLVVVAFLYLLWYWIYLEWSSKNYKIYFHGPQSSSNTCMRGCQIKQSHCEKCAIGPVDL